MKVAALRQKALRGAELKEADAILTAMLRGGTVTAIADRCALPDFRVVLTKRQTALRQKLLDSYRKSGRGTLCGRHLRHFPHQRAGRLQKVLENLVSCGELVMLTPSLFYHKDVYEEVCALTRDFFEGHPAFTLAEYQDLLGTSRKYALAILEFSDKTKVTKMVGDHREVIGSL
ncbi:MAG: SelB C-terminal domain-containing protein [Dysosmobacter sp.]